jgi:hypothetical protein
MILGIPLAIWFGILTIISLVITGILGLAVYKFKKNVFKYHMFFAFLTISLAIVHLIFGVMLWFFGIVI